ncbi:MAG: rod shape-determining protein MreD [Actinobacteria bacterium]|nr:rod shape-determining protein MreD [Actinomycetota bacterium]
MRGLISFVLAAIAVVVQVTVVARITWPGGAGPNLVLIVVAALALATGPLAGALIGFWAGLTLDVAPPGSHFAGQNALVFCLIGYLCGLLAEESSGDGSAEPGHSAMFEIVVTAAAAVCGEALLALLGVMLSDPRVTWQAVTRVLPVAAAYDVLLCPFVLYAVAAALRLAGGRGESQQAAWASGPAKTARPAAAAVRQAAAGSAPRLRMPDRGGGSRSIGSLGGARAAPAAKREPRLKLGTAGSRIPKSSPARVGQPSSVAGVRAGFGPALAVAGLGGAAKVRFAGRRGEGALGGSLHSGTPNGSARRVPGLAGPRPSTVKFSSSLGRSWLGGSVFGRSPQLGRSSSVGRSAALGRSSRFRRHGRLMRSPDGGLAGHAPRFSRGSAATRLTGGPRRSAGLKTPGRGWLRDTSSRGPSPGRKPLAGKSLGGKSLRPAPLTRASMGRGAFGRGRLGGSWLGGSVPRRKTGRAGAFGGAGLRMPRPKSPKIRRRRTGGYR